METVKVLLADQRVDPSAWRNYAILWAASNGHLEIVKLLLSDERVFVITMQLNLQQRRGT